MGYFGVKYLVRAKVLGKPKGVKRTFKSTMDLLEERVLIIRARKVDDAFKKAEREQARYCRRSYVSTYSQKVVFEPIACFDSFSLSSDDLRVRILKGDLAEVYSRTELVRKTEADEMIVNRLFGKKAKNEQAHRLNFLEKNLRIKQRG
jgi:hypothetical protein